jgi:hypothetical protein
MTDREMLELAAKAAGYRVIETRGHALLLADPPVLWNPLTDDGDALRLAVRLGISVHLDLGNRIVVAKPTLFPRVGNEEIHYDESKFGGGCDPLAATRRAITRAAAEIGKGVK